MQKSAAAIDQWPCLFLSSPEGGAGAIAEKARKRKRARGVQEGAEMGGNPIQKSAAAIDQWPCLFLSSPEGGAGAIAEKSFFPS
jgi:hypothetical protein